VATCLAFLDERFATNLPDWLAELSNGHPIHPRALMQQVREQAQSHKEGITDILDWMIAQWAPAFKTDGESTVVPVIERSLIGAPGDAGEGGLRRLTMKIFGTSREGRDEIDTDVRVIGVPANVIQVPIMAARRLLLESHPQAAQKFFTGKIAFEAAHVLHEGNSANLVIAALFYCAVLRHTDQRLQYRLAAHVAMTGDLNEKGEILAVDQATLGVKVKAAFFSWVECLVVPKSQFSAAEATFQELTKRYPHRHLAIIGVDHLREIFYDRRLTIRQRAGVAKHLAQKVWRNKFTVGGITTIVLLVLIIGKLLYGPIDRNPTAADFVEETMLVKNKYGEILDEIWVGAPTVQYVKALDYPPWWVFSDIDHDGLNEVIWLQNRVEQTGNTSMVFCKSVSKDTLLWRVPLKRMLQFPYKLDVKSDQFIPNNLAIGDFDADGKAEVFVQANHDFFPSVVMKLNATDGRELGHYIHVGHLSSMKFADLDGDGVTEVLLCGLNNAFRLACLLVLDPRFVAGHSPLAGDYEIAEYQPGLERAYVLIPKTMVGEAFRYEAKFNNATRIVIENASQIFHLIVREEFPRQNPSYSMDGVDLFYYFNFDLRTESIGTTDRYDLMAEKLFTEKRISRLPNYEYFEEFKRKIMYWDGEKWQNRPVKNKRYLETVKAK